MSTAAELAKIVITEKEIAERVKQLADQITADYESVQKPLVAIGLLRGAIFFMTDLIRQLDFPVEYDFLWVSSYRYASAPGKLELLKDVDIPIEGRDVLVLEDIVDTGHTLKYIKQILIEKRPASLKFCCLIDKPARREVKVDTDYVGFTVSKNYFLVGYGLDYAGRFRNLPYVAALKPEAIKNSRKSKVQKSQVGKKGF